MSDKIELNKSTVRILTASLDQAKLNSILKSESEDVKASFIEDSNTMSLMLMEILKELVK